MTKQEQEDYLISKTRTAYKAYKNKNILHIIEYKSKTGPNQFFIYPLKIIDDKVNPYIKGYSVDIGGSIINRVKKKISRIYLNRCKHIQNAFIFKGVIKTIIKRPEFKFDADLNNAIDTFYCNEKKNDFFGFNIGDGKNLKKIDLLFDDVFEQHLIKNRKDIIKSKNALSKKRTIIKTPFPPKKLNLKLAIDYVDTKNILDLIIGHIHHVQIHFKINKKMGVMELNEYVQKHIEIL
jgi:hypothetical protein